MKKEEQIGFTSQHLPILKSGKYRIEINQNMVIPKKGEQIDAAEKISQQFFVGGPRFRLEEGDVHSVFPPNNNHGNHAHVLPHITLNRSTLPWERAAYSNHTSNPTQPNDPKVPWLYLLVMHESDIDNQRVKVETNVKLEERVSLKDKGSTEKILLQSELSDDLSQKVTVVQLKTEFLKKLIPTATEIKKLASVRHNVFKNKQIEEEKAIVFSNRLPAAGESSYAFLISLENRYTEEGEINTECGIKDGFVSFISLKSWTFSCPDNKEFEFNDKSIQRLKALGLVELPIQSVTLANYLEQKLTKNALYRSEEHLKQQAANLFKEEIVSAEDRKRILQCLRVSNRSFAGILTDLDTGSFSANFNGLENDQYARPYLDKGALAFKHDLREGNETISWYHGPLITGNNQSKINSDLLPIQSSDVLYQYDKSMNMMDVSYAAAWELGRLLMLSDKTTSLELFSWKQKHSTQLKSKEMEIINDHLQLESTDQPSKKGKHLQQWFDNLALLDRIPFNYLVPDEKLLPSESLRFFQIDPEWIECLIDGAFSIGRISNQDVEHDKQRKKDNDSPKSKHPIISGFILRSEIVSGWSSLIADGYDTAAEIDHVPDKKLPVLKFKNLSPSILLCLFEGELTTVDFHLKAEGLHMGYNAADEIEGNYIKAIVNPETGKETAFKTDISWKCENRRIIDVAEQEQSIVKELKKIKQFEGLNQLNAGQFALEMISGVPRVRFKST